MASAQLTTAACSFINDNEGFGGTKAIKTNLLATLKTSQGFHINYSYDAILNTLKSNKIIKPKELSNKNVPIRTLVEYPIAVDFTNRMSTIKHVIFTADEKIKTTSIPLLQTNVNPDLIFIFENGNVKYFDIKNSSFNKGKITDGSIREVPFINEEVINYPIDYTTWTKQDDYLYTFLYQNINVYNMSEKDKRYALNELTKMKNMLQKNPNPMHIHNQFENSLMNINSLETFPISTNFYNIYHVKNGLLTQNEMAFLEEQINKIPKDFFKDQPSMEKYLIGCLFDYNQRVNIHTFDTLRPLRQFYPFIDNALAK